MINDYLKNNLPDLVIQENHDHRAFIFKLKSTKMIKYIPFACIVLLGCSLFKAVNAQTDYQNMYEKKVFISDEGDSLLYRILYPLNYNRNEKYPTVLFLHGSGERGNDNELQLAHGAELFTLPESREKYPAIVIFPQCPKDEQWAKPLNGKKHVKRFPLYKTPPKQIQLVIDLLDFVELSESLDTDREYIMGLSMGGKGTMEMLCYQPHRFAAAVPICGAHNPKYAKRYKHVSLWYFHGAKDIVVYPQYSRNMVARLEKLGANVRYTEYPDAGHNIWDQAFDEPDLLPWMFGITKIAND